MQKPTITCYVHLAFSFFHWSYGVTLILSVTGINNTSLFKAEADSTMSVTSWPSVYQPKEPCLRLAFVSDATVPIPANLSVWTQTHLFISVAYTPWGEPVLSACWETWKLRARVRLLPRSLSLLMVRPRLEPSLQTLRSQSTSYGPWSCLS